MVQLVFICFPSPLFLPRLKDLISQPPLLRADVQDVVAPDESITVLVLQLSVHVLLRLFQRNVHVAVQTGEHSSVIHSRIQLHDDWTADDLLQEIRRILLPDHLIHYWEEGGVSGSRKYECRKEDDNDEDRRMADSRGNELRHHLIPGDM